MADSVVDHHRDSLEVNRVEVREVLILISGEVIRNRGVHHLVIHATCHHEMVERTNRGMEKVTNLVTLLPWSKWTPRNGLVPGVELAIYHH